MSSGGKAAEQVIRESVDEAKKGAAAGGNRLAQGIDSAGSGLAQHLDNANNQIGNIGQGAREAITDLRQESAQEVTPHAFLTGGKKGLQARARREKKFANWADGAMTSVSNGELPSLKEAGGFLFQGGEYLERGLGGMGRYITKNSPTRGMGPKIMGEHVGDVPGYLAGGTVSGIGMAGGAIAQAPVTILADVTRTATGTKSGLTPSEVTGTGTMMKNAATRFTSSTVKDAREHPLSTALSLGLSFTKVSRAGVRGYRAGRTPDTPDTDLRAVDAASTRGATSSSGGAAGSSTRSGTSGSVSTSGTSSSASSTSSASGRPGGIGLLQDERGSLSLIGNQRGSLDLFGGSRRSDSGSGGSGGPSGPDGSSNGPEFDLNTAEGRHEALRQKLGPVYENAPPQKQALMHDAIRAPDGFRSRTMSFGHGTVQLTAGTGLMSKTLGTGLGGPALGIGAGFTMPAVTRGVSRLRGALGPRMPDRARSGWQTGVRKTDDALLGAESRLGAVRDRISSLNPFSSSDSGDADVDVEAGQYRPDMRDGVREGMDDAAPDEMSDFAPETYKAIEQLRAQRYDTGFESATMSYLRDATALSATNVVAGEVFSAAPRAIRNVGVPDGVRGLASDVPTGRVSNLVNSDGARFGMRSGALGTTKATVSRAGGAVRRTIDSASGRYESAKRAVGRIDQGIVNIEGPIVEEARTTYRSFRGDTSRPEDHTRNVEDVGERNHLDARRNNENPVLRDEFKDYFDGEINDLPPEEVDRLYSLYLAAKNGELGW